GDVYKRQALYGLAPAMDAIMAIARRYRLAVIEDAAQAYLSSYRGRLVGTIGDMGSFSLQSSKHITSGEGGIVITDNPDYALAVRRFGSLGYAAVGAGQGKISKEAIQDPGYARHLTVGWNYRLPELCSAVALAQFERIDELVERRRQVAGLWQQAAAGCDWLRPQAEPAGCRSSHWTWAAVLEHHRLDWRDFYRAFRDNGGDGIYAAWRLTYHEPAFAGLGPGQPPCPVAEYLQPRLLQFKTNYWRWEEAERQADILQQTIRRLG
ncbi:MAG: DegT/DnrJ/EryC1/StrS family aminotransferase, partial [Negativicutes bacterium]|nr:DegT/DnrJ/EryC1/StrS family aminotransferase [Negativicutes bacterium]